MAKTVMTLEALTERLRRDLGEALVAAVLYGSAARNERVEQRSDFNVLVIVRALTPALLRALASTAEEWGAAGNPPPLILTEGEWRASGDIFAMEVADILERHRVLAGAMPAEPSRVDPLHLRHQLEFEAMGKLLALRQGILASGAKPERELELLAATRSAVLVLFRTLLRIHGEHGADGPEDVVRRVAARAGFDATPFLEVVAHVAGRSRIPADRADAVLTAYHAGMERFVAHVDALVHPGLIRQGEVGDTTAHRVRIFPPVPLTETKMKKWFLLALPLVLSGCGYNTIQTMDESAAAAKQQIEVQLQRRADLVPNLVETVKGYAKQEETIFVAVAEARAGLAGAVRGGNVAEMATANDAMTGALGRLLAISENYPQLKSDQNFLRLQDELSGTENRIAVSRTDYNNAVRDYNAYIRKFPAVLTAKVTGAKAREYFEVTNAAAAAVPQVKF